MSSLLKNLLSSPSRVRCAATQGQWGGNTSWRNAAPIHSGALRPHKAGAGNTTSRKEPHILASLASWRLIIKPVGGSKEGCVTPPTPPVAFTL
ncbi:MAG: hypothetical protein KME26_14815 [Oscillatoria princeps RMCB-10]|nr:hypothetical protein [Oscillatoria princeps RMCB-10]